MKKRVLPLLMALALCLALLPTAALASEKPPLCDVYQGDGFYITAKPYKLKSTKYTLFGRYAGNEINIFYDGYVYVHTADVDENYVNRRFVSELNLADKDGNIVLPEGSMPYDIGTSSYLKNDRFAPSEGLVAFWDGKTVSSSGPLMGFMDYQGNVVIPCQFKYNDINPFHGGFAIVGIQEEQGEYTGIIDKTGREPFKTKVVGSDGWNLATYTFPESEWFSSGLLPVCRVDYDASTVTYGFVDERGNMALPLVTMDESVYDNGWGWSNYWTAYAEGKIDGYLLPLTEFSDDGYAVAYDLRSGDKLAYAYAIIDTSGNVVGAFRDMKPSGFHDGLMRVNFIDNRGNIDGFGYVDTTGNVVWSGDLAGTGRDYSCGVMVSNYRVVVDKKGSPVIPDKIFDHISTFQNNLSLAYVGDQPYVLEIHQGAYTGSGRVYDPSTGGVVGEKPSAPPAVYTTSAPSSGAATVQDNGETKTVQLYPAGTVITLGDGYSFSSIVNLSGDHLSTAGLKSFALPNDGEVYKMYIVPAWEYVYAKVGGGAAPAQPETPRDLAYASTQSVEVDGKAVEFQMYALKDANGNDTNYVKLRDVAATLNGTAAQFEVTWDGAVNIVTGQAYTANGTEMKTPFSGNRSYAPPASATRVDGQDASLEAIVLTDDAGAGYTYYKLRDLGTALGFTVDWSAQRGVFIETK